MPRTSRIAILIGLSAALGLGPAASTAADGLPVPVDDTGLSGISDRDGLYRYVSLDAGRETVVERIVRNGGAVSRSVTLHGEFTIPAVAGDGTASGLSTDGSTLVLIRPRPSFPRRTTELAILDAERLRPVDRIALEGDFSFDAISPDGRTMYLIEYVSPRDLTRYRVRAYDLDRGRLVPGAIVDPNESGDEMYGIPLSRATSGSGRWAYTLYWGNEGPFVHALDTVRGRAVCVDLDRLAGVQDVGALGFAGPDAGSPLAVERRGEPAALIDTKTFQVSGAPAGEAAGRVAGHGADPDRGTWVGWAAAGGGLLLIAVVAFGLLHARRPDADPRGGDRLESLAPAGADAGAEEEDACAPVP